MSTEKEKQEAMKELNVLAFRLLELRKERKAVNSAKLVKPEKPAYIFSLDEWDDYLYSLQEYREKNLENEKELNRLSKEISDISTKLKSILPIAVWIWTGKLWVGLSNTNNSAFSILIEESGRFDYNRLPKLVT